VKFTLAIIAAAFSLNAFAVSGQSSIAPVPHYPPGYPPGTGAYYNWGQGQDGWGHCYEWASNGGVLNEGQPVDNSFCGQPYFQWGPGQDGYTHCYEFGGRWVINEGQPVDNSYCGG